MAFDSCLTSSLLHYFPLQVLEHEAATGNPEALAEIRKEVMHLRVRAEALEADVKQKDKEIEVLNQRLEDQSNIYSSSLKSEDKLKVRR